MAFIKKIKVPRFQPRLTRVFSGARTQESVFFQSSSGDSSDAHPGFVATATEERGDAKPSPSLEV